MCRARSPCLFEPCCCWGFRGAEEVDRRGEEGRRPPHTLQRSRVASGWSHGPQSSVGVLRLGPQAEEAGCDGAETPPHERAPVDDGHAGMLRHKGRAERQRRTRCSPAYLEMPAASFKGSDFARSGEPGSLWRNSSSRNSRRSATGSRGRIGGLERRPRSVDCSCA